MQKKEQLLTSVGFRTVSPTTAQQTAHLKSLPQGQIVPVRKHGQTLFLLADAKQNRLLIGNQSEYQAYKQLRLQRQLSEDRQPQLISMPIPQRNGMRGVVLTHRSGALNFNTATHS